MTEYNGAGSALNIPHVVIVSKDLGNIRSLHELASAKELELLCTVSAEAHDTISMLPRPLFQSSSNIQEAPSPPFAVNHRAGSVPARKSN